MMGLHLSRSSVSGILKKNPPEFYGGIEKLGYTNIKKREGFLDA